MTADSIFHLYFDGSSLGRGKRGGPGPSAGAAVIVEATELVHKRSMYLARSDSDTAEFWGLIIGLQMAVELGASSLCIYGDSRNIIDPILDKKQIQKKTLVDLKATAVDLLGKIPIWSIQWIPRRKNSMADAEAKRRRELGV